jgi:hypothetical protein
MKKNQSEKDPTSEKSFQDAALPQGLEPLLHTVNVVESENEPIHPPLHAKGDTVRLQTRHTNFLSQES